MNTRIRYHTVTRVALSFFVYFYYFSLFICFPCSSLAADESAAAKAFFGGHISTREKRREERYERCIHVYVRRENAPEAGVEVRLRLPGRCHCTGGALPGSRYWRGERWRDGWCAYYRHRLRRVLSLRIRVATRDYCERRKLLCQCPL